MRVLVTGATGFVGAHTTAALERSGHDVVALVRDERRLARALGSLDAPVPAAVVGDMGDATVVGRALDGCDAVIHCAAVVSLDRRHRDRMLTDNLAGFRTVVGGAVERGVDPVVHLSSVSALFTPGRGIITTQTPVADAHDAYARSKAACEHAARELQAEGAPVVTVYPSGILGPAAGGVLGETAKGMAGFIGTGMMPTRDAQLSWIDVRDLAAVLVALLEPGRGPVG